MKLGTKITLTTGALLLATIFAFAGIVYWRILSDAEAETTAFRETETQRVQHDLMGYVDMAYRILSDFYEQSSQKDYIIHAYGDRLRFVVETTESLIRKKMKAVADGNLSREEAQEQAANMIRELRYDKGVGYVWINDMGRPFPKMIMHPVMPELEGQTLDNPDFNCALGRNENLFSAAVDLCAENGEGFLDYLWPKPAPVGSIPDQPKLSYVKLIPEWNWIVGSGVYVDDARAYAIEQAVEKIRNLRYDDGENYFWINDMGQPFPKIIMHPVMPELEGQTPDSRDFNLALESNENIFAMAVALCAENGEGFLDYLEPKPTSRGVIPGIPKKAYVRLFEPLNWIIGTGMYIDEIDKAIIRQQAATRKQLAAIFSLIVLVSLVLFLFALCILHFVIRSIVRPITDLTKAADQTAPGNLDVLLPVGGPLEIRSLSKSLDRKRKELKEIIDTLHKSEEYLSATLRSIGDGVIACDQEGRITTLNKAAETMTGWTTAEAADRVLEEVFHIINAATREVAENPAKRALREGIIVGLANHTVLVARNGREYQIADSCAPIKDSSGKVIGAVLVFRDVTVEYRQREKLRDTTKLLEGTFNAIHDIIGVQDTNHRVVRYNSAGYKFLNMTHEQTQNRLCYELIGRTTPCEQCATKVALHERRPAQLEKYLPEMDIWLDVRAYPILDESGGILYVIEYLRDITEQKRSEKALKESENYLRTVLTALPDVLVRVDRNGKYLDIITSDEKKLYLNKEQLLGKTIPEVLPEYQADIIMKAIGKALRDGSLQTVKYELPVLSGKCWFEARISPLNDTEVIAHVMDITERHQAETQKELLVRADKMAALGTLVAGVAHEINNPNNFISINIRLLADAWRSIEPILEEYYRQHGDFLVGGVSYSEMRNEVKTLITGIEDGSERIKRIVEDLKSYARPDEEQVLPQQVNINTVVEKAANFLARDIRRHTHNFSISCGVNVPPVLGRQKRLEQVVINLIQNACQALDNPDKAVRVETSYNAAENMVVIVVRDEGVGMDEETKKNLVDPFFTTKRETGGTGLGMFVVAEVVRKHGGVMNFESEPGHGTTIVIKLPGQYPE